MGKRNVWMRKNEFTPVVTHMLQAFETVFRQHTNGYTVTYFRDDAVFVMVNGYLNCYYLARMVCQFPEIGFDVEAAAPGYVILRMFSNEYEIKNNESRLPEIQSPVEIHQWTETTGVRVRADAKHGW